MKKIVITGGFGFIGSLLVRHFQQKGIEVIVLEHPGATVPAGFPSCEILRADITQSDFVSTLKVADCDALLHLAAQSSGPRSFHIPEIDIQINILGTAHILKWADSNKIERVLFASSFVIYGDHADKEMFDENTIFQPKSVYASSKLTGEYLLKNWAEPKGIRWNSLRMFNVYGPGQDITKPDQGVVGIFMNMLLQQDSVQVKGSLDRFRDLIHIEDVIQMWDRCLFTPEAYNQALNVGSGIKTTFSTLIEEIATVLGKRDRLEIVQLPGTPGDMMGCYADISKAKEYLGYQPKYNLHTGLLNMYEWVQSKMSI